MPIKSSAAALAVSVFSVLAAATPAHAQIGPEGYLVGALGGWSDTFTSGSFFGAAAGGGARFGPYLGAGAEIGLFRGSGGGGLLSLSADGRVRIVTRRPGQRMVPFIGGGYTYLNLITGSASGWNVGGGLEYELNPRRALRIEFRDVIKDRGFNSSSNYWFIRTGITFR